MNELEFTVEINASKQRVWDTLWQDETFQQWSGLIDPGTYMKGELQQGNEVEFISAENGYGVTSLVAEVIPAEYLLLKHQADTQDSGEQEREKEWTGGEESYRLKEVGDVTILTVTFGVPATQEEYFKENYPKALDCVKALAEGTSS